MTTNQGSTGPHLHLEVGPNGWRECARPRGPIDADDVAYRWHLAAPCTRRCLNTATVLIAGCEVDIHPEVDHGSASNEVTKRQDQDHHPKSNPVFFDESSSADTSAVRSSLSPDAVEHCTARIRPGWWTQWTECGGEVGPDGLCSRHGHSQGGAR